MDTQSVTQMSNQTLAQFGAIVMDTLHGYGHLPPWENAMVTQRGAVHASLHGPSVDDTVRALATWADTFHASVLIDSRTGHVSSDINLCEIPVSFKEFVGEQYAARLAEATVGSPIPGVVATGEQVLAGLDVLSSVGGEQS